MISRRHLRIKVMQALYAYFYVENDIVIAEKNLLHRIEKIYDLYLYLVQVLLEIHDFARKRMEDAKHKHLPSADEINPNLRFLNNKVIKQITENSLFNLHISKNKINLMDEEELIRRLFTMIRDSKEFQEYMQLPEDSYREDKKIIQTIFYDYIFTDTNIQSVLEEKNLFWADDSYIASQMIHSTISYFKEASDASSPLPSVYKKTSSKYPDEDREYVSDLFRKTILNNKFYEEKISSYIQNWDIDRIAQIDFILMKMALCEILEFPNVPVKVTMNEYIDIAKEYSSPSSHVFINGILDKMVIDLKKEDKIKKFGRGLKE